MLVDRFGRIATDLRVSLTDRCNLRCTYCMPVEGLAWLPKPEMLTDDEVVRLVRVAVEQLGVREVRFTGGEPLLRPGLVGIVAAAAELSPRPELSLTTNGIGLAKTAVSLKQAGLDRVNVSLDTLDEGRFAAITHRDRLADVFEGLAAADAAGLRPVKVNAVLLRGINEDEAPALLRWCLERGYELRIIEQMPLDPQHGWDRADHGHSGRDAGLACPGLRPRARTVGGPGECPGGAVPGRRRAGPGGHHRLGDQAVLRRLRPRPAHRRRAGAQLPVRPGGVRPAVGAAGRRGAMPSLPRAGGPLSAASGLVTASTTRHSCSRTAR